MTIWALADLHLSFGTPQKKMDLFGEKWRDHAEKIEKQWRQNVGPRDLVLIPGDISWAMTEAQVAPDLAWIDALPGTKVMIRGNHDYWWQSLSKVRRMLPPSLHVIQNDAFFWEGVAIAGTRLWDSSEFSCGGPLPEEDPEREKIFERELQRLEMSLKAMESTALTKIALTHYPPVGFELLPSRASALLERYGITIALFGHLHTMTPPLFGTARGIHYHLTACDYLNFCPLKVL